MYIPFTRLKLNKLGNLIQEHIFSFVQFYQLNFHMLIGKLTYSIDFYLMICSHQAFVCCLFLDLTVFVIRTVYEGDALHINHVGATKLAKMIKRAMFLRKLSGGRVSTLKSYRAAVGEGVERGVS